MNARFIKYIYDFKTESEMIVGQLSDRGQLTMRRFIHTFQTALSKRNSVSLLNYANRSMIFNSTSTLNIQPVLFSRQYHDKVIDHYEKPRNVGSMDKADSTVGTGLVGAPACGDVMRLQIKVDPKTERIQDVKFKTFGCGSAIASSSLATEWIKGKTLDEAEGIKNVDIAKELCLPPVKLHCSMLAEDAIKSAVRDFRTKRKPSVVAP